MRKCYNCKETKEECDFVKNKNLKDGFTNYCKYCARKQNWLRKNEKFGISYEEFLKQQEKALKQQEEDLIGDTKTCSTCNIKKNKKDFHIQKSNKDGLRGICKDCRNKQSWDKKHIDSPMIYNNYRNKDKKICSGCKILKDKDDYYRRKSRKKVDNGIFSLSSLCKICERQRHLKQNYNINLNDYQEMLIKQDNKCLICKKNEDKLVIDHCHVSGIIRGLLCNKCNSGLGYFLDNIDFLRSAIKYLKGFKRND